MKIPHKICSKFIIENRIPVNFCLISYYQVDNFFYQDEVLNIIPDSININDIEESKFIDDIVMSINIWESYIQRPSNISMYFQVINKMDEFYEKHIKTLQLIYSSIEKKLSFNEEYLSQKENIGKLSNNQIDNIPTNNQILSAYNNQTGIDINEIEKIEDKLIKLVTISWELIKLCEKAQDFPSFDRIIQILQLTINPKIIRLILLLIINFYIELDWKQSCTEHLANILFYSIPSIRLLKIFDFDYVKMKYIFEQLANIRDQYLNEINNNQNYDLKGNIVKNILERIGIKYTQVFKTQFMLNILEKSTIPVPIYILQSQLNFNDQFSVEKCLILGEIFVYAFLTNNTITSDTFLNLLSFFQVEVGHFIEYIQQDEKPYYKDLIEVNEDLVDFNYTYNNTIIQWMWSTAKEVKNIFQKYTKENFHYIFDNGKDLNKAELTKSLYNPLFLLTDNLCALYYVIGVPNIYQRPHVNQSRKKLVFGLMGFNAIKDNYDDDNDDDDFRSTILIDIYDIIESILKYYANDISIDTLNYLHILDPNIISIVQDCYCSISDLLRTIDLDLLSNTTTNINRNNNLGNSNNDSNDDEYNLSHIKTEMKSSFIILFNKYINLMSKFGFDCPHYIPLNCFQVIMDMMKVYWNYKEVIDLKLFKIIFEKLEELVLFSITPKLNEFVHKNKYDNILYRKVCFIMTAFIDFLTEYLLIDSVDPSHVPGFFDMISNSQLLVKIFEFSNQKEIKNENEGGNVANISNIPNTTNEVNNETLTKIREYYIISYLNIILSVQYCATTLENGITFIDYQKLCQILNLFIKYQKGIKNFLFPMDIITKIIIEWEEAGDILKHDFFRLFFIEYLPNLDLWKDLLINIDLNEIWGSFQNLISSEISENVKHIGMLALDSIKMLSESMNEKAKVLLNNLEFYEKKRLENAKEEFSTVMISELNMNHDDQEKNSKDKKWISKTEGTKIENIIISKDRVVILAMRWANDAAEIFELLQNIILDEQLHSHNYINSLNEMDLISIANIFSNPLYLLFPSSKNDRLVQDIFKIPNVSRAMWIKAKELLPELLKMIQYRIDILNSFGKDQFDINIARKRFHKINLTKSNFESSTIMSFYNTIHSHWKNLYSIDMMSGNEFLECFSYSMLDIMNKLLEYETILFKSNLDIDNISKDKNLIKNIVLYDLLFNLLAKENSINNESAQLYIINIGEFMNQAYQSNDIIKISIANHILSSLMIKNIKDKALILFQIFIYSDNIILALNNIMNYDINYEYKNKPYDLQIKKNIIENKSYEQNKNDIKTSIITNDNNNNNKETFFNNCIKNNDNDDDEIEDELAIKIEDKKIKSVEIIKKNVDKKKNNENILDDNDIQISIIKLIILGKSSLYDMLKNLIYNTNPNISGLKSNFEDLFYPIFLDYLTKIGQLNNLEVNYSAHIPKYDNINAIESFYNLLISSLKSIPNDILNERKSKIQEDMDIQEEEKKNESGVINTNTNTDNRNTNERRNSFQKKSNSNKQAKKSKHEKFGHDSNLRNGKKKRKGSIPDKDKDNNGIIKYVNIIELEDIIYNFLNKTIRFYYMDNSYKQIQEIIKYFDLSRFNIIIENIINYMINDCRIIINKYYQFINDMKCISFLSSPMATIEKKSSSSSLSIEELIINKDQIIKEILIIGNTIRFILNTIKNSKIELKNNYLIDIDQLLINILKLIMNGIWPIEYFIDIQLEKFLYLICLIFLDKLAYQSIEYHSNHNNKKVNNNKANNDYLKWPVDQEVIINIGFDFIVSLLINPNIKWTTIRFQICFYTLIAYLFYNESFAKKLINLDEGLITNDNQKFKTLIDLMFDLSNESYYNKFILLIYDYFCLKALPPEILAQSIIKGYLFKKNKIKSLFKCKFLEWPLFDKIDIQSIIKDNIKIDLIEEKEHNANKKIKKMKNKVKLTIKNQDQGNDYTKIYLKGDNNNDTYIPINLVLEKGINPLTQKFLDILIEKLINYFYQSIDNNNHVDPYLSNDTIIHKIHFLQEIMNKILRRYNYMASYIFQKSIILDHQKYANIHKALNILNLNQISFLQFYLRIMFVYFPNSGLFELFAIFLTHKDYLAIPYKDKILDNQNYYRCYFLDEIYTIYEDIFLLKDAQIETIKILGCHDINDNNENKAKHQLQNNPMTLIQVKSLNDLTAFLFDYNLTHKNFHFVESHCVKYLNLMIYIIKSGIFQNVSLYEPVLELSSHLIDQSNAFRFNGAFNIGKLDSKKLRRFMHGHHNILSTIEVLSNYKNRDNPILKTQIISDTINKDQIQVNLKTSGESSSKSTQILCIDKKIEREEDISKIIPYLNRRYQETSTAYLDKFSYDMLIKLHMSDISILFENDNDYENQNEDIIDYTGYIETRERYEKHVENIYKGDEENMKYLTNQIKLIYSLRNKSNKLYTITTLKDSSPRIRPYQYIQENQIHPVQNRLKSNVEKKKHRTEIENILEEIEVMKEKEKISGLVDMNQGKTIYPYKKKEKKDRDRQYRRSRKESKKQHKKEKKKTQEDELSKQQIEKIKNHLEMKEKELKNLIRCYLEKEQIEIIENQITQNRNFIEMLENFNQIQKSILAKFFESNFKKEDRQAIYVLLDEELIHLLPNNIINEAKKIRNTIKKEKEREESEKASSQESSEEYDDDDDEEEGDDLFDGDNNKENTSNEEDYEDIEEDEDDWEDEKVGEDEKVEEEEEKEKKKTEETEKLEDNDDDDDDYEDVSNESGSIHESENSIKSKEEEKNQNQHITAEDLNLYHVFDLESMKHNSESFYEDLSDNEERKVEKESENEKEDSSSSSSDNSESDYSSNTEPDNDNQNERNNFIWRRYVEQSLSIDSNENEDEDDEESLERSSEDDEIDNDNDNGTNHPLFPKSQLNVMKDLVQDQRKILDNCEQFFTESLISGIKNDENLIECLISNFFTEKDYMQKYDNSEACAMSDSIRLLYKLAYHPELEKKILDCITLFLVINFQNTKIIDILVDSGFNFHLAPREQLHMRHKFFTRYALAFLKYYVRRTQTLLLSNQSYSNQYRLKSLQNVEKLHNNELASVFEYSFLERLLYFSNNTTSIHDISAIFKILLKLNNPIDLLKNDEEDEEDSDMNRLYLAKALYKNENTISMFFRFWLKSDKFIESKKIVDRVDLIFGWLTKYENTLLYLLKNSQIHIPEKINDLFLRLNSLLNAIKKINSSKNGVLSSLDMTKIIIYISKIQLGPLAETFRYFQSGMISCIKKYISYDESSKLPISIKGPVIEIVSELNSLILHSQIRILIMTVLEILEIFAKFKEKDNPNFHIIEVSLKDFVELWIAIYSINKIINEIMASPIHATLLTKNIKESISGVDQTKNIDFPLELANTQSSEVLSNIKDQDQLILNRSLSQEIKHTRENDNDRNTYSEIFMFFSQKCQNLISSIFELTKKDLEKNETLLNALYHFPWIINMNTKVKMLRAALINKSNNNNNDEGSDDEENIKKLKIRRENILEDSMKYFQNWKKDDFKNLKIEIQFIKEAGVDQGGIKREWLSLLVNELFNPNCGLFKISSNRKTIQPEILSVTIPNFQSLFKFAGQILGFALKENIPIDVAFTKSFLKQILGQPISINDLEDYDLPLYKSMIWMLDNNIDSLEQTFSYEMDIFGEYYTQDIIPNGRNIIVNEQNKKDYIKAFCNVKLIKEINLQTKAFLAGFNQIIPNKYIKIFLPAELESLICGESEIDRQELKKYAKYKECTINDKVVIWFWDIVDNFDQYLLQSLWFFVTGSSRIPHGGISVNPITIVKSQGDINTLPLAHTCYAELELPNYASKPALEEKLLLAIIEGKEGFHIVQQQ